MPPNEPNSNPNAGAAGGSNTHPNNSGGDRSRPPPPVNSSTKKGDPQLVPVLLHYRYKNHNAGEVCGLLPDEAEALLKQKVQVGDETIDVAERYSERQHGKTEHGKVVVPNRRDRRRDEE